MKYFINDLFTLHLMAKQVLGYIFKIISSIVLLIALWMFIDINLLVEYFSNVKLIPLVLLFFLVPFSIAIRSIRFQYVVNFKHKLITFKDSFILALVGETLNIILPASGGDVAKAYYGFKKHNLKEEMISSVVLDKVIGLMSLLLLGVIASFLIKYYLLGVFFGSLFAVVGIFVFVPSLIPWRLIGWFLSKLKIKFINLNKLRTNFSQPLLIKLITVLYSLVGWIVSYLMLYVITQMFSININILFLFTVAPLITLSRLLPISWAGLGVQEGVTIYLFNLIGVSMAASVAISLVFTLSSTIIPGLFGWYHIIKLKNSKSNN